MGNSLGTLPKGIAGIRNFDLWQNILYNQSCESGGTGRRAGGLRI
jgi:hypothetical protein